MSLEKGLEHDTQRVRVNHSEDIGLIIREMACFGGWQAVKQSCAGSCGVY